MEGKIFNPWNENNKEIPESEITKILGFPPTQIQYYRQACVHKSFVASHHDSEIVPRPQNCLDLKTSDNEHLEFIGDGFLDAIVGAYLERRFPGEGEGFWTSLRSEIVNNNHLGNLAIKIGLSPWLIISRHMEETCNGRKNLRMLGSMLEAWVAAIWKDRIYVEPTTAFWFIQQWVIKIIEEHIDFGNLLSNDKNFKGQLLKYFQSTYHQPVFYKEISTEGPVHNRIFTIGVLLPDGSILSQSSAKNKKEAEQEASRIALIHLGLLNSSKDCLKTKNSFIE